MAERTDARMWRWMHMNIRQQFWVQTIPMRLPWFDTAHAARDCIFDMYRYLFVYVSVFFFKVRMPTWETGRMPQVRLLAASQ